MLKLKYIFWLFAVFSSSICFAGNIPANNDLIEYSGRIDFSNPLEPTFSYSGVSIRASFTGTSISAIMNDSKGKNYYTVLLDGEILDVLLISVGKKIYKIAEGLEDKTHEIEIFKRTEQQFGKTQFYGFVLDDDAALVPIENSRSRLIEYIGNSITCGYGNEGVNGEVFGPATENHYMTYAAINSRNFNARHLPVCKSGIGIYRNFGGPEDGNEDCMTNYYTRVFLYNEDPKYSFSERPDLVCINLGTNDFSKSLGDSAKYVSNYFRLIDTIQSKYDKPDILCLLGPMLTEPTLSNVRDYLGFIADSASRKDKGNVYFFEMSLQTGSLGIGINYHPTVEQHKKNAMELSEYIKNLKGWKITPLAMNAKVEDAKHLELKFNTILNDTSIKLSDYSVRLDDTEIGISDIYVDATDANVMHVLLQDRVSAGDIVTLSYTPGSTLSEESVSLGRINSLVIENNLASIYITKCETTLDGSGVKYFFNRNLNPNSSIEGLTLRGDNGTIGIQSFDISGAQLIVNLDNLIRDDDSVLTTYNGSDLSSDQDVLLASFSDLRVNNVSEFTDISLDYEQMFSIYPNPNHSGIIHYSLDKLILEGGGKVEILDEKGVLVFSQRIFETKGSIDLGHLLEQGVFFFRIKSGRAAMSKLIMFE